MLDGDRQRCIIKTAGDLTVGKLTMPSKRIFDLVVITSLLLHPAVGLVKMSARRWSAQGTGATARIGDALVVGL